MPSDILHVAYFTHLQNPVQSGPGRFSEQLGLHSSMAIQYTCFTDNRVSSTFKEIIRVNQYSLLRKLPIYWLFRSFLFYKAYKAHAKKYHIVICSNAFEAFFLALRIKDKPVVVMINDDNNIFTKQYFFDVLKKNSPRKTGSRYVGYFIERYVAKQATLIIACSSFLKERLVKSYLLPENKVITLYPAVDTSFFIPQPRNYFPNARLNVLFVKNDWRRGGLETLIEALSFYPESNKVRLTLVGVTNLEKPPILHYVKKYKFSSPIHFRGILNKKELLQEFYANDLFILPSRQEAFGITLLEALATSTPVIASNIGGIPEALDLGSAGLLIPADSPYELMSAILELIEQPRRVQSLVDHGLIHHKKFSIESLHNNLDCIVNRIVKDFPVQ